MQPSDFSLESVRQLMLANGGRITNHDLVKSYKRWLTDPQEKENARAQFKDYVNTLASIKQENGEKYLILKKKFYPEYYSNNCGGYTSSASTGPIHYDSYNSDSNYNSSDFPNSNSNYPVPRKPSSNYYDPGANVQPNYHHQNSYEPPQPHLVNSYSRQNSYSSGLGPASVSNGNNSPSLLDEVMAGWAPPSRSSGRQLPSVPHPSSGHNSLGLPTIPQQFSRQSSQQTLDTGQFSRQSSQQSLDTGQFSRQSSQQALDNVTTREPRDTGRDTLHYNSGFNPHMTHHQQQRSSVASVSSLASGHSGSSYHGPSRHVPGYVSPPSSYTSGSPRGSISVAPPPSHRNSYTSVPLHNSQANSNISSRAPPPYRAPPPDPLTSTRPHPPPPEPRLPPPPPDPVQSIQSRPLPDKPRHSELHHLPADPVLPQPYHPPSSPPPPPRRTVPSDGFSQQPPPPLPKRQLPSTANLQPLDLGLPIPNQGGRSKAPNNHQQKFIESQQPSPTDSGFTEDPSKFSDYPLPRNSSLSKSIGNLTSSTSDQQQVNKLEGSVSLDNLDALPSKEDEKSVSVRERTKTFNRMASETELPNNSASASASSRLPPAVKRRNSRAVDMGMRRMSNRNDPDDTTDSASITTIDPTIKQWMVHTSKGDYQVAAKMLMENPKLSRHKDFTSGYTGLHWAAKHGHLDMVKLLAGTYQANVNAKSHGGYTPLHIAAQHNHQEVFDLLVQVK